MRATIEETTLPDLYKVLALRENLTEDIQKRMAHLFQRFIQLLTSLEWIKKQIWCVSINYSSSHPSFSNGPTFQKRWLQIACWPRFSRPRRSLKCSWGSKHDRIHALNSSQPTCNKTSLQFAARLGTIRIQSSPKISSLADFDCWIDAIVGAEELRGAKINSYIPPKQNQSMRSAAAFPPTILNASIHETSERPSRANNDWPACPACNDNPGHRLEACVIFRKILPSQWAAFCGQNNHCLKCLRPGHYGRSFRNTDITCNACSGKHHTLIHGAERVFPGRLQSKGNKTVQIFQVHAPKTSLKPVLLAIAPIIVRNEAKKSWRLVFLTQAAKPP